MNISQEKKSIFEIKSASLSLLEFRLYSNDIATLEQLLKQRYAEGKQFFNQELVILNTTAIEISNDNETDNLKFDIKQLILLISNINLIPVAIISNSNEYIEQAQQANLYQISQQDIRTVKAKITPKTKDNTLNKAKTVIVDKPVRSGQQIYAKNADLIVMAMVSQGAEVIADGNIHVYAPLRGRAIAGASGDINARIFSTQMQAELLSIAGLYRTSEEPIPDNLNCKAVQVRLLQQKIVFTAL